MRVLRVRVDEHQAVELHPAVTVVSGLDPDQRSTLRRALAAVGSGLAPDTTGLVEAHGVLLDLDQDALDLLDVADAPCDVVVTPAHLPGAVPVAAAARLRIAEHEVRLHAAARRRAVDELAAWEARQAEVEDPAGDLPVRQLRAASLRLALDLHRGTDAEPVRVALDVLRDEERAALVTGRPPVLTGPASAVAEALAGVGIDVRELDLPVGEVVRIAEEWVDEVQRRRSWAVGAAVELQGIESWHPARPGPGAGAASTSDQLDRARGAAAGADRAHAEALADADVARTELVASARPVDIADLEWHLLDRVAQHRQARLAGAVPLVLDGLLDHLTDDDVTALLDRLSQLAGSVQLVVLGDDTRPSAWARAADPRRAAAVAPAVAAEVGTPT